LCRWFDARLFGGLLLDIRRRYRYYGSDIIDGLNLQCLATVVFLYFACITPIVTFGGLLGKTTDGSMVSMLVTRTDLGTRDLTRWEDW